MHFILYNSRSAIRSRSRSPQQLEIAEAMVSAKIRKCVSLAWRTLSRSSAFFDSSAVFVNIGNPLGSCIFPFRCRRSGRGGPRPPMSDNTYRLRPLLSRRFCGGSIWHPRMFRLEELPQHPSGASPFPGRFRGRKSVRVLCPISQTYFESLRSGRYNCGRPAVEWPGIGCRLTPPAC